MWGEIEVPSLKTKIEFLKYSSNYHDQAIEVIRKSFFKYESVCIGSEINFTEDAQKDLEKLCDDALIKSDVSFIARDVERNKIVGIAINVIQTKPTSTNEKSYFETFRDDCCKTENAKALMNYMIEADSRVDIFEKFKVDSLLEIMFLAVLPDYGRNGIGMQLCKHSIELARQLNLKLVSSLFTGKNTQNIGRKLGFNVIVEESFNNFSFNGKTFAERNGDKNLVYHLVAKVLSGSAKI